MTYSRRKALKVKFELLAEGALLPRQKSDPWPVLKAKLDKAFSELVRRTYADDCGFSKCITCGMVGHWKDFDCGHFVDRDQIPTRWDIENCRPQCEAENRFKSGKRYEFGRALNAENPGSADRLILRGKENPELIRMQAPQLLLEIREKLKIQRKRFR
jgi:hypothetical protein